MQIAVESRSSRQQAIDPVTSDLVPSANLRENLTCMALGIAMTACMLLRIEDGVMPHDSGTLGHAAERVLQGELPHRDFDSPYSGLQCMLNAGLFHVFGVHLQTMRLPLVPLALCGFLVLYRLLRKAMPILSAALITSAAFAWSVPNYFSAMPSWYNLFLTIFAAAAMLQYVQSGLRRWLVVAGLLTGISFLFKVIGVYFTATAALLVIFVEQRRSEAQPTPKHIGSSWPAWLIISGLAAYVAAVGVITSSAPYLPEFITFWCPSFVLSSYLAWNERRLRYCGSALRMRRLLSAGGYFCCGFLTPIAMFLVPYFLNGGLENWFVGVFVTPLRRLSDEQLHATLAAGPFVVGILLLATVVGAASILFRRGSLREGSILVGLLGTILIVAGGASIVYAGVWATLRLLPLVSAVALICLLVVQAKPKRKRAAATPSAAVPWETAFLLTATSCVFSLVQVPVAHGIYFLYAAPPLIAAAAVLLSIYEPRSSVPTQLLGGGLIIFAAMWIWPGNPLAFGRQFATYQRTAWVETPRGTLRYDPGTAHDLSALVDAIEEHTEFNDPILALPDFPEAYFLTGRVNPTRTFFDVFDADYASPERDYRLLNVIERSGVKMVVLRNIVSVSTQGLSDSVRRELRRRFPNEVRVMNGDFPVFTIRWREAPPLNAALMPLSDGSNMHGYGSITRPLAQTQILR